MPPRPLRPCRSSGCTELVINGWCTKHQASRPERLYDEWRGSPTERGYDAAWWKFRAWFIKRHPLCEDCLLIGVYKSVEEVHHLKKVAEFPELRLREHNCISLCKAHHSARTARGE